VPGISPADDDAIIIFICLSVHSGWTRESAELFKKTPVYRVVLIEYSIQEVSSSVVTKNKLHGVSGDAKIIVKNCFVLSRQEHKILRIPYTTIDIIPH
jgi:hypothetical protein